MWRLRNFSYLDTPAELQKLDGKKKSKLAFVSLTQFVGTALFFHATTSFYRADLWKKTIVKCLYAILLQQILGPDIFDRS